MFLAHYTPRFPCSALLWFAKYYIPPGILMGEIVLYILDRQFLPVPQGISLQTLGALLGVHSGTTAEK
jgi:hypothetical protein